MSLKKRDDHYIPQCLLRFWGTDSGRVCYMKRSPLGLSVAHHSVEKKIQAFYRNGHDHFFNVETLIIDDLNKYRSRFENGIKKDVQKILSTAATHRAQLEKDHKFASQMFSVEQKLKWIRFYYLTILMTPLLQKNFENAYHIIYRQVHGEKALEYVMKLAGEFRISPSTIVSEKFNNWVLSNYNEIFISFVIPSGLGEEFLASDAYMSHHFYNSLIDSVRTPFIPLHPKLLLRVFFQKIESKMNEHLQLRYFFEAANFLNDDALKYGTEILGSSRQHPLLLKHHLINETNLGAVL